MLPYLQKCDPPSDDKRWKIVAATMRKLGNQRHALIEALHSMQDAFGYLDKPGLTFVAGTLRIPLSQVYGAATFYHHFSLKPQGRHSCIVCTGTACHIKGAGDLLKFVTTTRGIKPGETTADGALSLLTARCFGTCGLAPVAVIDGETVGRLTNDLLDGRIDRLFRQEAPQLVS
jgi:bidirectional [NiFe] hydrogenase diaphorase subunit